MSESMISDGQQKDAIQFTLVNYNIQAPYIFHDSQKPYTLVLDLDETLIHYNEEM